MQNDHYKGQTPLEHLVHKQAEGISSSQEPHGLEVPGSFSAAYDAARDCALVTLLLFTLLTYIHSDSREIYLFLVFFLTGYMFWKGGRTAWLGWMRLEKLHRVMSQEKWEIEHNRPQEREELIELYGAKGFEGRLLEEVVDVLMADDSRLLKVMIEDEMRLSLSNIEHPLKQAVGAFIGALLGGLIVMGGIYSGWAWGPLVTALITIGVASWGSALLEKNRVINAVVWSVGLATFAWNLTYFSLAAL